MRQHQYRAFAFFLSLEQGVESGLL
jgi:hypothetical protein